MAQENDKKTVGELTKLLGEKRKALQGFRFDISGSRIKDLRAGRNIRKEIARIITSIHAKSAKQI